MTEPTLNDNDAIAPVRIGDATASGLAAILVIESLIHGLIDRGLITVNDAIEIVTTAQDVLSETIGESLEPLPTYNKALGILDAIGVSLQIDAS